MPAPPRLRLVAILVTALAAPAAAAEFTLDDRELCRDRATFALSAEASEPERIVTARLRTAIAACERALDAEDLLLATLVEELGHVSLGAGRNDEAGQLLRRALAMRERVQGADHVDTVDTAAALAEVLWQRAHHTAEAEALLRRALAVAMLRADDAGPAERLAARDLATRRALQLTRFLLDQWRLADAVATLAVADDDPPPLEAGHRHNARGEIALGRRDLCAAADAYRRAAEEYRYAYFVGDTHSDRRWLHAWVENAPTLLVRVGQRDQAGQLLARMIASRIAIDRGDQLTARAQGVLETLAPASSDGPRC